VPLTPEQIDRLATAIEEEWDVAGLTLFASDHWRIPLGNLAPGASLKIQARELITRLNSRFPPADHDLLLRLRALSGVPRIPGIAGELLTPMYVSPTHDPHDAILLGEEAFVDRAGLRAHLRDFTNPSPNTTRVLIIRGKEPCGKSYSYGFLRHLAQISVGAHAPLVPLEDADFTPKRLMQYIFALLDFDGTKLPAMADEPQLARTSPLISTFLGQARSLQSPFWLVFDDINHPSVTREIRDTVYAIARGVEAERPPRLWVVLIGYNDPVTDPQLRRIKQDDARFPDASLLAQHFQWLATAGQRAITPEQAREYADDILGSVSELTKEAMISLTTIIENIGGRLLRGQDVDLRVLADEH
jgi:hypothetical protein